MDDDTASDGRARAVMWGRCLSIVLLVDAGCTQFVGAQVEASSASTTDESIDESTGGATGTTGDVSWEPVSTSTSSSSGTSSSETTSGCEEQACKPPPPPEPRCDDGLHNADETDVDCGGPACPPCAARADCISPDDCQSGVCEGNSCAEASCEDGFLNGDEVDVDCGGSCGGCTVGSTCERPQDCTTETCASAQCQPRACSDLPADWPSGVYPLYFDAPDATRAPTDAFCDMDTDGGGWTLLLAYDHSGGTKEPLVAGTLPTSPESGFSHASAVQVGALREGATSTRFFCTTSAHPRVLHFRVDSPGVLDFLADLAPQNDVEWWTASTPLAGHTAVLPSTTDDAPDGLTPDLRMVEFPFYEFGVRHWGIRGFGVRWECDDYPGDDANDTLHQVWIR